MAWLLKTINDIYELITHDICILKNIYNKKIYIMIQINKRTYVWNGGRCETPQRCGLIIIFWTNIIFKCVMSKPLYLQLNDHEHTQKTLHFSLFLNMDIWFKSTESHLQKRQSSRCVLLGRFIWGKHRSSLIRGFCRAYAATVSRLIA